MSKLFSVMLLCLLISCGKKRTGVSVDQTQAVTIPVKFQNLAADSKLKLSDFVDSVKWIPLELTQECIIGKISQVYFLDSLILVVDTKAGTLLFFDMNGKYRNKIDRRGKGPGEYATIRHALYDFERNRIMVYDDILRKLIYYRMDGTMIKEIQNFNEGYVIRDLVNLPDGRFLCYTDDGFIGQGQGTDDRFVGMWLTDSTGRFICNLLHYDILYPRASNTYQTYLHKQPNGEVIFMDPIHNDVYLFSTDTLRLRIRYDIQGPKAVDYPGTEITDQPYISATLADWKGNYLYTWWADDKHKIIFTLFDHTTGTFQAAGNMDADIPGAVSALPVYSNLEKVYLSVIPGSAFTRLLSTGISMPETKDRIHNLTVGMTSDQIESMNPILQLWFVKP